MNKKHDFQYVKIDSLDISEFVNIVKQLSTNSKELIYNYARIQLQGELQEKQAPERHLMLVK